MTQASIMKGEGVRDVHLIDLWLRAMTLKTLKEKGWKP